MRQFCATLAAMALSACATQANLTIYSQPDGAYITEAGTGTAHGIAPVTVYYNAASLAQFRAPDGCYIVGGFEARWVSGVTAALETIRLCGGTTGNYTISVARDPAQPNLEKDLQFALQVQTTRAQQQQAQASEDSALIAAWATLQQSSPKTVRCSSTQVGNTVQTRCN